MMGAAKREVAIWLRAQNQLGPGVQAAMSDLDKIGEKGDLMFKRVTQAGLAAFAALAIGAATVGASFEQSMANTSSMFITAAQQTEGLQNSMEVLAGWEDQLAAKARDLGATTAFAANEAADAMYALASGGLDVNQVIASSDSVLKLAGATLYDMNSTAEVLMSTLTQFQLKATDSARMANVFAAGIQNSQLNMERLTNSMAYAGPMASSLGMSIEETVSALALLHNAGLKGSMAGTGLRMALTKLIDPSKELQKVLGGVTISADGFNAVLKKLEDAKLDPQKMAEMFGPRAYNAINALTKAGKQGFDDMTKAVTGTNAAADMYKHQMDTVASQTKILKSGVRETFLAIFDVISGTLRDALAVAQAWVASTRSTIVGLFDSIVTAARENFDNVRLVVQAVVEGLYILFEPLALVATYLDDIGNVIASHAGDIEALTTGLGAWALGLWAVHKAAVAVNAVMAMNPVLAALTALVVLISLAAARMGGWEIAILSLRTGLKKWVLDMKYLGVATWNDIKFVAEIFGELGLTVKRVFNTILQVVSRSVGAIGDWMGALGRAIANPFHAVSIISEARANFETQFAGIKGLVVDGWDQVKMGFNSAWDGYQANQRAAWETYNQGTIDLRIAFDHRKREIEKAQESVNAAWEHSTKVPSVTGLPYEGPPSMSAMNEPAMLGPENQPFTRIMSDATKAMDVVDEFKNGLANVGQSAWDSIIDSSRTGAEKWKAIWQDLSQFVFGILGKITIKKLLGDQIMLASSKATNAAEQAENTKTAATGFFKAYAGLPFVGQVLAMAAIAAMVGFIGKMHDGGPVTGSGEQLRVLMANEYVMPEGPARRNFGLLEAIRRGETPVASAAGAGGPRSITAIVQVPEGSLLMADDRLAVRRMAVALNEELVRVQENYKES